MKTIELNDAELAAISGGDDVTFWTNVGKAVGYITYQIQQAANSVANAFVNGANSYSASGAWQAY